MKPTPLRLIILAELPAPQWSVLQNSISPSRLEIFFCSAPRNALAEISRRAVHAVILDLTQPSLPGAADFQAHLHILRESAPDTPLIAFHLPAPEFSRRRLLDSGFQEELTPSDLDPHILETVIRHGLKRRRLLKRILLDSGQLDAREKQHTEIIHAAPDGVLILDDEGCIRFMNPSAETIMGGLYSEFYGKTPNFAIAPGERGEISIPHKNGATFIAEFTAANIEWQGKNMLLLSLRNITEERRAIKQWIEEKEWISVTLESIGDGVIGVDNQGRVRLLNSVAEEMTGWSHEEAEGRPFSEVAHLRNNVSGHLLNDFNQWFLKQCNIYEGVHSAEESWALVSRYGKELPVEFSCSPIRRRDFTSGAILIVRDVAEKRATEEELIRAQNLEAIGLMAGGLTHEFNNVLTSTLEHLSQARKILDDQCPQASRLQKAIDAGARARDIPNRLSAFLKTSAIAKRPCRIRDLLQEAASELLEEPHVKTYWSLPSNPPILQLDPSAIRLAFKNIFRNAIEAVNRNGEVNIDAETVTINRSQKNILQIKAGRYFKITIHDTGPGVDASNITHIFDPFFTTKSHAEGMGLTTAYSIIRRHGGAIQTIQKEGQGCSFDILLPMDLTPEETMKPESSGDKTENVITGKGRLLVMDDEESVREIIQEMLEFLNYDVVLAENGDEAIQIYHQSLAENRRFDAVILDLVVPGGMNGKECMERLLEMDPQIRAIVSSGYSHDPVMNAYREYGFIDVLPKPYKIQDLNAVLKRVLELS